MLCGTEGALLYARLPEREAIPRLLDKVTKRHGVPPRDAYLSVGSPTEQDGSKAGSGRGRPRAPSWRRLRFCRLRTGQCPAVTTSCCRLNLGMRHVDRGCGGSCNRAQSPYRLRRRRRSGGKAVSAEEEGSWMWPVAWAMAKRSRATSTTWPGGTSSRCRWSSSAAPLSRRKLDQPKKEAGSAEGGAYPRPRPRAAARQSPRCSWGETRRQKLPGAAQLPRAGSGAAYSSACRDLGAWPRRPVPTCTTR